MCPAESTDVEGSGMSLSDSIVAKGPINLVQLHAWINISAITTQESSKSQFPIRHISSKPPSPYNKLQIVALFRKLKIIPSKPPLPPNRPQILSCTISNIPNPIQKIKILSKLEGMEAEWELYRTEIETLYMRNKRSLEDVMSYMSTEHSFTPR